MTFGERYRSAAPKEGAQPAQAGCVTDVGVGSSAWLGDRKSIKPECQTAALAFPFSLRSGISNSAFLVRFISVKNSPIQSSFL
jgi:hypothetical protein